MRYHAHRRAPLRLCAADRTGARAQAQGAQPCATTPAGERPSASAQQTGPGREPRRKAHSLALPRPQASAPPPLRSRQDRGASPGARRTALRYHARRRAPLRLCAADRTGARAQAQGAQPCATTPTGERPSASAQQTGPGREPRRKAHSLALPRPQASAPPPLRSRQDRGASPGARRTALRYHAHRRAPLRLCAADRTGARAQAQGAQPCATTPPGERPSASAQQTGPGRKPRRKAHSLALPRPQARRGSYAAGPHQRRQSVSRPCASTQGQSGHLHPSPLSKFKTNSYANLSGGRRAEPSGIPLFKGDLGG